MNKLSLGRRVLDAVLAMGECTVSQVLAEVGYTIPAAQAAAAARQMIEWERQRPKKPGRRRPPTADDSDLRRGKRRLVQERLRNLLKAGKIQRVGKGIYAPLPPKLYSPKSLGRVS